MSELKEEKIGYRDILHQKEYMKILIAGLINRLGDSIDAIAATWIVYELTSSASWSAIVYAINKIPTVIITPLAGAWVEGRNKKRIMVVTDLLRAVCVAFIATGYLMGFLEAWMLLITNFIISTVEAFRSPASTAMTPKVLESKYYDYGMSLSNSLTSIVELIGMGIAGGVIALIGTSGAIYIDMATFLLSAGIICFVKVKEKSEQKQGFHVKEYANTFAEGMSYTMKNQKIMFYVLVGIFLNGILVPYNSLRAPLASEILKGGPEVTSLISVTLTVTMLLGSVVYPKFREKTGSRFLYGFAGISISVFFVGMVLFQPLYDNKYAMYAVVAVLSGLLGFAVVLFNTYTSVEMMREIEEDYLARVMSLFSALVQASSPIVSFVVSALLGRLDIRLLYVCSGIAALVFIMLTIKNKALNDKDEATEEEGVPVTE